MRVLYDVNNYIVASYQKFLIMSRSSIVYMSHYCLKCHYVVHKYLFYHTSIYLVFHLSLSVHVINVWIYLDSRHPYFRPEHSDLQAINCSSAFVYGILKVSFQERFKKNLFCEATRQAGSL